MSARAALAERPSILHPTADAGFAVYVHWPFCLAKCPYCDFNSHVRLQPPDQARYIAAFRREIAHRAALLYSFATLLIAVFVEFSAWPAWINLSAAMVAVFFFVAAIGSYIVHGARRDTENQFAHPPRGTGLMMAMLIGKTNGCRPLVTTSRPSTADSTVTAGVSMPSL